MRPLTFSLIAMAFSLPQSSYAASELTFQIALDMAQKQSMELQLAQNQLALAKFEREAFEKKNDPKFSTTTGIGAKYSESPTSQTSRASTKAEPGTLDESYLAQVSVVLLDFGRDKAEETKLNFSIAEKEAISNELQEALTFKVGRAYAKVLTTQDLSALATHQMQNATKKYEQVKANYAKGLRPEYDFVRAELDLGRARVAAQKASDELVIAKQQLQSIIDSPQNFRNFATLRCTGSLKKTKEAWASTTAALSEQNGFANQETRRAQHALNQAELLAIDARLLPQLSALGSAAITRSNPFPKTQNNDYRTTYSAGLSLTWEIPWNFAYRDDIARVALKEKNLWLSNNQDDKLRNSKKELALSRGESLREQITLLDSQALLAEKNVSIVRQKYEAGKASATELSVAEDERINALSEVLKAHAAIADALFDVAEANGSKNLNPIFLRDDK